MALPITTTAELSEADLLGSCSARPSLLERDRQGEPDRSLTSAASPPSRRREEIDDIWWSIKRGVSTPLVEKRLDPRLLDGMVTLRSRVHREPENVNERKVRGARAWSIAWSPLAASPAT